jgi:hypothetical protein
VGFLLVNARFAGMPDGSLEGYTQAPVSQIGFSPVPALLKHQQWTANEELVDE